jgi:hypothetical protein
MSDTNVGSSPVLRWAMTNAQCKVCTSPDRFEIEVALAENQAQDAVARRFSQNGQEFSKQNIHSHYRRHMGVIDRAVIEVASARMRGRMLDLDSAIEIEERNERNRSLMRQQVAEQIESNGLRWTARDAMSFIELDARLGELRSASLMEDFTASARAYSEAVKSVVPQSLWPDIVEAYYRSMEASGRTNLYRPDDLTAEDDSEA